MGASSAETVTEIEDTRDRIEAGIRELETRLPRPAVWTKRLIGVAVGGGVGGTLFWFGVRTARKRKATKEPQMQAVVKLLPDDLSERLSEALERGQLQQWALGIGAAWIVLRLAELRQLRRMNRALVVSR